MKKLYFSLLALALLWAPAKAQTDTVTVGGRLVENEDRFSLGLHLLRGLPLCELKDGNYQKGLAFDLEILTPSLLSRSSPLAFQLGLHFDYMGSGSKKAKDILVSDPANARARYTLRNSSVGLHLMGRLSLSKGPVRPYIDGILGLRGIYTSEEIRLNQEYDGYERITQNDLMSKGTFIYGGSLGALFHMGRGTYFDLRVTYSHGSTARYADLNTFQKVGDGILYATNSSKTPLLFVNVGFVFRLNSGSGDGGYYPDNDRGSNNGGISIPRSNRPSKPIKIDPPKPRT